MSYQAMGWATEQDIPAMQKIVLLMLANRMNQDTGRCFPSHNRLATECGMSKRSVIRQIEKLEKFGFLSVIRETQNGAKIRNQYVLPIHHPKQNMFICDFGDVIPKSDIASMEHPLFSLSTKPDIKARHYEHNGNIVDIFPSVLGLATIHDKDILIYCISQLMAGINRGEEPSRKIRFKAHDLLVTTNRQTGGEAYTRFRAALKRLKGTSIETNIKTNGQQIIKGFGLIDNYEVIVENYETKRMIELEITLSEWLYHSVIGQDVLSISRDYFRLRKPIERRVYEIARKHCGLQKKWHIKLKNLHKKVGSSSSIGKFKLTLKPR